MRKKEGKWDTRRSGRGGVGRKKEKRKRDRAVVGDKKNRLK